MSYEEKMISNKKFSQTSPDKANELFAKLLDTSDTAVKTRERLFSELKEELELLANLQEQYLFPVLRKHEEMSDLVQEATNDNKETSALLEELDLMPKGNGQFVKKLADLRKVFQQHIRDDKKELLPAVLKVLSDEEIDAVVEKVEDEMVAIEQAKRNETEQRQAETRRAREQTETVTQVTEDIANTVRAGMEGSQRAARTMQDAVQSSLGAASEMAHMSTDRMMRIYGFPSQEGQDLAEQTAQHLRAIAQSSTVLARGIQDVSQEWIGLAQDRMQKNLEGLNALARCRSMPDFVALQSSLMRNNLEQMLESTRRIAELSSRITNEASRTMTVQAERIGDHAKRAA
jgi:phasin family protein